MPAEPAARHQKNRRSPLRPTKRRLMLESLEERSLLALVSYWSADNTAIDSISGNNGTLQNGATYAAGQVNQAFKFDGVDDRVLVADSPSLAITQSLSIEAWVRVDGVSGTSPGMILFRGDDRGGLDPYSLSMDPSGPLVFRVNSASGANAAVFAAIPQGQFVHIAATLDDASGLMSLYENGVLVAHMTTSVRPFGALDPTQHPGLGIGNANSTYNAPFKGAIDDLKLYNHALTAGDVKADFLAAKGPTTISVSDASAVEGSSALKVLDRFVNQGSGLSRPRTPLFGPDGNGDGQQDLYVISTDTNEVLRFDGKAGTFLDTFVTAGSGGLVNPGDIAFGRDGSLYVSSIGNANGTPTIPGSGSILRYDGTTGAFIGSVATGLTSPLGITFGPDGSLFTVDQNDDQVMRISGGVASVFVAPGSGGLDQPRNVLFGTDANGDGRADLYVSSQLTNKAVLRYDGQTGAFIDTFASTNLGNGPAWMDFAPDGTLVAAAMTTTTCCNMSFVRFDGASGARIDELDTTGEGWSFKYGPDGLIYASGNGMGNFVDRIGASSLVAFTVSLSYPSDVPVTVDYSTSDGTALAGVDYQASSGTITFAPGQTSRSVLIPTYDDSTFKGNRTFTINLSAPVNAPISDGQGAGTIVDNDPAPQISISDAAVTEGNRTITYLGNAVDAGDGGMTSPSKMIFGPDGKLYVTTFYNVFRYDSVTGNSLPAPGKSGAEFISPLASGDTYAQSLSFGPDGDLYVVSESGSAVLRFDPVTGESLGALLPAGSGGLDHPRGLLFYGGYVYVTSRGGSTSAPGKDSVLRYDASTGAPAGISGQPGDAVFIASGGGGLDNPSQIVFQNGAFYVASTLSNSILKYGTDGSFLGAFVVAGSGSLSGPHDLAFRDGYLYVASPNNNKVLRYNGTTGAFVDEIASGNGLVTPLGILFEADGNLLVGSRDTNEVRRYGEATSAAFTISMSIPSSVPVSVNVATASGTALAGPDFTAVSNAITFAPGETTRTILVKTLDDTTYEGNETFTVNLSNPGGGVVLDGQGVGTIVDNDPQPTKFYVVDDGSANKTYEYGANGAAVESYAINSGNTTPRGAASTAAGDKVWVVDANKTVYVYNTSGGLLGSWAAGSLPNKTDVQGITVNGTDVWIVDAQSDKVYRYAGAASRVSGSQTAASSFALNTANSTATDLVTDGSSIWVTNNSKTDQVFKYTVSGTLLGKWTISGGGGSPTGITIDPTNVSNIWIVDNATDRVYQFDAAASRTSGSQAPSTSFALASGNTNPQGIADPPTNAGGMAYDSALLAVIGELDDVLGTGKKR